MLVYFLEKSRQPFRISPWNLPLLVPLLELQASAPRPPLLRGPVEYLGEGVLLLSALYPQPRLIALGVQQQVEDPGHGGPLQCYCRMIIYL